MFFRLKVFNKWHLECKQIAQTMTYAMWAQPRTGKNCTHSNNPLKLLWPGVVYFTPCPGPHHHHPCKYNNFSHTFTFTFSEIVNGIKCVQHGQDTTESKIIIWHIFLIFKSPEILCIFTPPHLHHFHLETIPLPSLCCECSNNIQTVTYWLAELKVFNRWWWDWLW